MANPSKILNERLRKSFSLVKEDISSLKSLIEANSQTINELKAQISPVIEKIRQIIPENQNKDSKQPQNTNILSSTGNEGVINDQQRSTINDQQSPTIINSQLSSLKQSLTSQFSSLTDREFSVFLSIYELESSLGEVTYTDLAKKLSLTEATVRGVVNSLISKNLPVQKERLFNKKATLTLSKEFRDLNLLSKLIKLRSQKSTPQVTQKTLFDL